MIQPAPAAPAPVSLEARDVTFRFDGTLALDRVSLRVDPGTCVALVGESGAGKTTLLRSFNRMVIPSSGEVLVNDRNIAGEDPAQLRRGIGYVPQQGGLLPHWTVVRNAALVPDLLGWPDPAAEGTRSLEMVGLDPRKFGHRFPAELSGGQRQRVALARAIAARPGVLLMDEPFGALDAITRSEMRLLCRQLRVELGVTTLLVTHDLVEAEFLADEVVVMKDGAVEQRGTFEVLQHSPSTPYVASLFERALAGSDWSIAR